MPPKEEKKERKSWIAASFAIIPAAVKLFQWPL